MWTADDYLKNKQLLCLIKFLSWNILPLLKKQKQNTPVKENHHMIHMGTQTTIHDNY